MNSGLKIKIIGLSFLIVYINFYNMGFVNLKDNPLRQYDTLLFVGYCICFAYMLHLLQRKRILYMPILVKIIIFTILLIVYFFMEQLLIMLAMYNIGGSGG